MKTAAELHSRDTHGCLKAFKNLVEKWFKFDRAEHSLHDKTHFSFEFFDTFSASFPLLFWLFLICLCVLFYSAYFLNVKETFNINEILKGSILVFLL